MDVYQPEDLEPLQVALLGALSLGLAPPREAGSDEFRVDHVTAVVQGLQTTGNRAEFLAADGIHVTSGFRDQLRAAIADLVEKGLVMAPEPGMPAAPGGFEAGILLDVVNPDEHPIALDRYLGQACMEVLLRKPAVHPFLMDRYSASGAVWRRLREEGYAS